MQNSKIVVLTNTIIKQSTADSSSLPEDNLQSINKDSELEINWYRTANNDHWEFELDHPIRGLYNWFAFDQHIRIEDPDSDDGNRIIDAVYKVNAERDYYLKRDITGDGKLETFCNWFAGDVLDYLEVPVPRYGSSAGNYPKPHPIYGNDTPHKPKSATDIFRELGQGGPDGKWKTVDRTIAIRKAKQGKAAVACCPRPNPGRQGHIAIILPRGSVRDLRIAQAGAINKNNMRFEDGFGSKASIAKFFVYD